MIPRAILGIPDSAVFVGSMDWHLYVRLEHVHREFNRRLAYGETFQERHGF